MRSHSAFLLSLSLLSACQATVTPLVKPSPSSQPSASPAPSASPNPSPSASPSAPAASSTPAPSASPTSPTEFTLKGRFVRPYYNDPVPDGIKAGPLDGSSPVREFKPGSSDDFSLAGLPRGKDLRIEFHYTDSSAFTYQLKAAALDDSKTLLISPASGPYTEGSPTPQQATISGYVLTEPGFTAGQMTHIKLRSLDPVNHPFEASIYTWPSCDGGTGSPTYSISGVPPLTPVEITAEFANFQPKVYALVSPDLGKSINQDLTADLVQPDFMARLGSPATATWMPGESTVTVDFNGLVTNTVTGAVYKAVSLDPRVPFQQTASINEGHFFLSLPVGVDLELTTTFDGAQLGGYPFDGTLERGIHVMISDPRFNLPHPYGGFIDTIGPSNAGIRQIVDTGFNPVCDLAAYENTAVTGTVSNFQGQPLAGVKIKARPSAAMLARHAPKDSAFYDAVATTGPSGKFSFPGISSGYDYEFTATLGNQSSTQTLITKGNKQGDPNLNKLTFKLSG